MKYFSLFSGVGGFEIALDRLGYKCVGLSENNKYSASVLRYHYPDIINYGDINTIRPSELPDFDLLVGGSPCQDLSVAGKQKGLTGKRSGLFYKYLDILKEKKPKYFIWENVEGALYSNNGWDFAEIQSQFYESGYDFTWQLLNARKFGVPQSRPRIFIIGYLRGTGRRKVLSFRKGGRENIESTEAQAFNCLDANMYKGIDNHGQRTVIRVERAPLKFLSRNQKNISGDYSFAIDTSLTGGFKVDNRYRKPTPLECERLMTWPDNWTKYGKDEKGNIVEISDTQRWKMCGNGVVSKVIYDITRNLLP